MAVKCSSSGGNSSAMKASLVLMLLFGAVVAAHAKEVDCQNLTCKDVKINGVTIKAGVTVKVNIDGIIYLSVTDVLGKVLTATSMCPADVTKIKVVYVNGVVKIQVVAVGLIAGLLNTILGTVLCLLKAVLGC